MSSGHSSVSNMTTGGISPARKRPLLPPINASGLSHHASKQSSPDSTILSFGDSRSSNVHGLLNHAEQRLASTSPASSTGPVTPNTTLPPVNVLTGVAPSKAGQFPSLGAFDASKNSYFHGPSPSDSMRSSLPSLSGLGIDCEGRRGSDASMFSNTSPINTITSSSFHQGSSTSMSGAPPIYQRLPNGTIQFMTTSGLVVPIDTQLASRVADEKRRRNAGASARFRQRRKEKEKESQTAISRLETKVKELEDMNIWYRAERDHLRQVCISHGLQSQVGPRPVSPKVSQMALNNTAASSPSEWQQQGERGIDQGPNQRRRVGDYFEGVQVTTLQGAQHHQPPVPRSAIAQMPHDATAFGRPLSIFGSHAQPRNHCEQHQQPTHKRHCVETR